MVNLRSTFSGLATPSPTFTEPDPAMSTLTGPFTREAEMSPEPAMP